MAVIHFRARVDEEGNLVLPVGEIPPGTEVEVSALVRSEGLTVQVEASGKELRSMRIDDADPACREIRDAAMSTMDFWDNPVDNEVWG